MAKRKCFSPQFKLKTVRFSEKGNKPAAGIARELRVRRNQLR